MINTNLSWHYWFVLPQGPQWHSDTLTIDPVMPWNLMQHDAT